MNTAAAIAAAESRAHRAEIAALETQIRLAIAHDRLAELETVAARRRDAEAERAVRQLVTRGAIGKGDAFTMHEWKNKFLADAALIPLAVGKVFNMRVRKL
ncbi:MAG TPA: hypothetical protein VH251_01135 [Verrucomicrobiae bacterium]|jgi:hypothetical protein|nr:hypothetical protein [Verrucomicrobiae bacterium]